jgi:hypothetical protein
VPTSRVPRALAAVTLPAVAAGLAVAVVDVPAVAVVAV